MDERLGEINALKSLLSDTDYRVIKSAEELLTCTTATGLILKLAGLGDEIRDTIQQRAQWRRKINELEADLEADLEANPPQMEP